MTIQLPLALPGVTTLFDSLFPNARPRTGTVGWRTDPSGCWQWLGGTAKDGYPKIRMSGKSVATHRWMYERLVGPIPEGMTLDHLCRNVACVNPEHLEPCSVIENIARGTAHRRAKKELLY